MVTGLQALAAAVIVLAVSFGVVAVRRGRRFEALETDVAKLKALQGSDDRIGQLLSPPEQDRRRRGFGLIRGGHVAIPLALVIFTATSALALWLDGDGRRGSEVAEATTTVPRVDGPPPVQSRPEPPAEIEVRESPQPLTATVTEDVPAEEPAQRVPPERGQAGSGGLATPSLVSLPPLPDMELPDVPGLLTTTTTSEAVDPPACVADVEVLGLGVSVCAAS